MASAPRVGFQRRQDPDRPYRRGFDFLGFSVRRYAAVADQTFHGGDPANPGTAPHGDAQRRGSNAAAIIAALTPIIRGWAAYYRGVVSSKTFNSPDNYLWALTYKWATHSHANKPKTLGRDPLLRQTQQVQERPLGIR